MVKRVRTMGQMPALAGRLGTARAAVRRATDVVSGWRAGESALSGRFLTSPPSPQTALDAISVDWASRFPPPLADVVAGEAELFDDERMHWGFERLGGLSDRTVLELGPLEGAHSYMAQQAGARQIVAVEANTQAFLKCLVVKELLGLDRCSFLCGDVAEYLTSSTQDFDVCFACGILYHMADPVRLIDLISHRASAVVVWTHYYDSRAITGRLAQDKSHQVEKRVYKGFEHELHRHGYAGDRGRAKFWGGNQAYSSWLSRQAILDALEHFGWGQVEVAFDDRSHPNGPAFALVAQRGGA